MAAVVATVLVTLLFASSPVRAQTARHVVSGTIHLDRVGIPGDRLNVTLVPANGAGRREVFAESTGRFEFTDLPAGTYTITVRAPLSGQFDDGIAEVTIYASPMSTRYTVTITLPVRRTAKPPVRAGTIDATIPKPARDAFDRGVEEAARGASETAIARFREAVAIAPGYGAAWNDLGVELLRLERNAEALDALRRAVAVDQDAFPPRVNLALALLATGSIDEAEAEIGVALARDSGSSKALCAGGQIAHRAGRLQDAVDRLLRAMAAGDAMQAAAALELGAVCETAGRPRDAVGYYTMVVALEAGGPRAAKAQARLDALAAAGLP